MFFKNINDLKQRFKEDVTMISFIVSTSPLEEVKWWSGYDAIEFSKRNVLFQKEDKKTYVKTLLEKLIT